jgi:hypothetical protein
MAGYLTEPAGTNKCTNYNVNPTALTNVSKGGDAASTLTVVSDAAALATAGLANISPNGNVYKLDNSLGSTWAAMVVAGASGNTNTHSYTAWVRGSGTGKIGDSYSQAYTLAFTATSGYVKKVYTGAAVNVATSFTVYADPGAIIYVIGNQMEETSYSSSMIVTSGAAATRSADVLTYPNTVYPNVRGTAFANFNSFNNVTYTRVIGDGNGSNGTTPMFFKTQNALVGFWDNTTETSSSNTIPLSSWVKGASTWSPAGKSVAANGGAVSAGTYVQPTLISSIGIGLGGNFPFQGTISNVTLLPLEVSDNILVSTTS